MVNSYRTSEENNGPISEVLKDGTRVQKHKDGTTLILRKDGVKIQKSADGTEIEVRPDGTRKQKMANGTIVEVNSDGSTKQINIDGTVVETFADKRRVQNNRDGSIIESFPDGRKSLTYPDGKRVSINKDGEPLKTENEVEAPRRDSARGIGRVPRKKSHVTANEEKLYEENDSLRESLTETTTELNAKISEQAETIETLEKYILEINDDKENQIRIKENQISHLNSLLEKFESEKNQMKESMQRMKSEDSKEMKKLKEELKNTRNLNSQLMKKAPSSNVLEELSELKSLLFEKETKINELSNEAKAARETSIEKNEDLEEIRSRKIELEEENEAIQKQRRELETKVEDLIHKGGSVAEDFTGIQQENEELKRNRKTHEEEMKKLNLELSQTVERNSELETQISNLLADAHSVSAMNKKRDLYLSKYRQSATVGSQEEKTTSFDSETPTSEFKIRRTQLAKNLKNMFRKKKGEDLTMKQMEIRIGELEVNIEQKDLMLKKQLELFKDLQTENKQKDQKIFQLNSVSLMNQVEFRKERAETVDDEDKHLLRETNAKLQEEVAKLQEELKRKEIKIIDRAPAVKKPTPPKRENTENMKMIPANPECPMKFLNLYKVRGNNAAPVKHAMKFAGIDPELLFPDDCEEPAVKLVPNEEHSSSSPSSIKAVITSTVAANPECPERFVRMSRINGPMVTKHAMKKAGIDVELLFPGDCDQPALKEVTSLEKENNPQVPATHKPMNFLDEIKKAPTLKKAETKPSQNKGPSSAGAGGFLDQIANKAFTLKAAEESKESKPVNAGPPDFLSAIKSGVKLKPVKEEDVKPKTDTNLLEGSLLDAIKKKQQTGLKKISFRSPAKKEVQKSTVAELCQLKAQQRATRTERISDLVNKRKNQIKKEATSKSNELKSIFQRRAAKNE